MKSIPQLETVYENLTKQTLIKENADMSFSTQVKVDIGNHGDITPYDDIQIEGKVTINYNIELEARSWGIKGITVSLKRGSLQIPITLITFTEGENEVVEQELKLDTSIIKIKNIPNVDNTAHYISGPLELYLEKQGDKMVIVEAELEGVNVVYEAMSD